jgi:6-phosphogluconate dehydrogenase (decarboxylating)
MVPAGDATEATINDLAALLSPGDIVVDGGNARYTDSMRRGETWQKKASVSWTPAPPAGFGDSKKAIA